MGFLAILVAVPKNQEHIDIYALVVYRDQKDQEGTSISAKLAIKSYRIKKILSTKKLSKIAQVRIINPIMF
jgi:hypothetical protein